MISRTLQILFLGLFIVGSGDFAKASEISDLKQIQKDYRALGSKSDRSLDGRRNKLQLKATAIIQKMAVADRKLSSNEIESVAEILILAVPVDPAAAIIENNLEIIKANLNAIRIELKKAPTSESKRVLEAIDIAIASDERGTNDVE